MLNSYQLRERRQALGGQWRLHRFHDPSSAQLQSSHLILTKSSSPQSKPVCVLHFPRKTLISLLTEQSHQVKHFLGVFQILWFSSHSWRVNKYWCQRLAGERTEATPSDVRCPITRRRWTGAFTCNPMTQRVGTLVLTAVNVVGVWHWTWSQSYWTYSLYCFFRIFIIFKIFIYLFTRDREREKQRRRQREKQAPCREPGGGLDPRTPGHSLSRRQMLDPWATQVPLILFFLYLDLFSNWKFMPLSPLDLFHPPSPQFPSQNHPCVLCIWGSVHLSLFSFVLFLNFYTWVRSSGMCLPLTDFAHSGSYSVAPSSYKWQDRILSYGWGMFQCVYVHLLFFICSSMDGHLGYFHILAVVKGVATNIRSIWLFEWYQGVLLLLLFVNTQ